MRFCELYKTDLYAVKLKKKQIEVFKIYVITEAENNIVSTEVCIRSTFYFNNKFCELKQ